jgi:hypothetical protein
MGALQGAARSWGILAGPGAIDEAEPGDALWRAAPGQHVATLVRRDGDRIWTVDGGQGGGLGAGTEIGLVERHLVRRGSAVVLVAASGREMVLGAITRAGGLRPSRAPMVATRAWETA